MAVGDNTSLFALSLALVCAPAGLPSGTVFIDSQYLEIGQRGRSGGQQKAGEARGRIFWNIVPQVDLTRQSSLALSAQCFYIVMLKIKTNHDTRRRA